MTHEEVEMMTKLNYGMTGEVQSRLDRAITTYNDNFEEAYKAMKRMDNAINNTNRRISNLEFIACVAVLTAVVYKIRSHRKRIFDILGFGKQKENEEKDDEIDELIDDTV